MFRVCSCVFCFVLGLLCRVYLSWRVSSTVVCGSFGVLDLLLFCEDYVAIGFQRCRVPPQKGLRTFGLEM